MATHLRYACSVVTPIGFRRQHRKVRSTLLCSANASSKTQEWLSSDLKDLSSDEARSLSKVITDSHSASLTKQQSEALLKTIKDGVIKAARDLQALEGSILAAEQLYLGNISTSDHAATVMSTTCPKDIAVWQPIFASSGGFPRLLYIPVPEYFDVSKGVDQNIIDIITELGPITTHFLGTCTWLSDTKLTYSINKLQVDVAGRSFTLPFKLDNDLTFFLATEEFACARSKLGGTMLLAANPDGASA
eukprot:jgi/Chrzof1/12930/Cz07g12210.t1